MCVSPSVSPTITEHSRQKVARAQMTPLAHSFGSLGPWLVSAVAVCAHGEVVHHDRESTVGLLTKSKA